MYDGHTIQLGCNLRLVTDMVLVVACICSWEGHGGMGCQQCGVWVIWVGPHRVSPRDSPGDQPGLHIDLLVAQACMHACLLLVTFGHTVPGLQPLPSTYLDEAVISCHYWNVRHRGKQQVG